MTERKKIIIATKNQGKVREMRQAFQSLPVELIPLSDLPGNVPEAVEDGDTFQANSQIKAKFYQEYTGMACLADDSGLEVEALAGAPGVHSARFAGEHANDEENNRKLQSELRKRNLNSSPAAYRCVLTLADTNGAILQAEGSCQGEIRTEARGNNGFGYDPYFYVGEKSMAELTLEEKQAISHRGAALEKMAVLLKEYLHENRINE